MATTDLGVIKPINKGAWLVGNTYEVLNMVTDNAKIYMANKDVPANTPLTELEFWINMSGDGMTVPALQAWAISVISDANKLLTEVEQAVLVQSIIDVSSEITLIKVDIANKIEADSYASTTIGGTIKLRVDGTDCFITTNGTNA